MSLGLPNFRLAPFVAVTEAAATLGFDPIPGGGSTDPYLNTRFYSTPGLSDQSDPDAIYDAIVSGAAPLQVKVGKPTKQPDDWLKDVLIGVSQVVSGYLSGGTSFLAQGASELAEYAGVSETIIEQANLAASVAGSLDWSSTMSLWDGFDFDAIVDFTSNIIDDVNWGNVLEVATPFATSLVSGGGNQVQAIPAMAKVPAVVGGAAGAIARVGPTVGRSFFNKFPNLAVTIQKLRNAGQNVSRSKLYSMMRRFGPEFMVSAGLLSAAAVSELILAGPGHRRMNVGNVKALRRGMRRIEGFHKLCSKADRLRRPKARVTVKSCR